MKKNDGNEELKEQEEKWDIRGRVENCFVPFKVNVLILVTAKRADGERRLHEDHLGWGCQPINI